MRKNLLKNSLVVYQGGGYDGCWWEWNFFALNDKKEFIQGYSSGINGINNIEQAKNYLKSKMNNSDIMDIFSLKSFKDLQENLVKNYHVNVLQQINEFLTDKFSIGLEIECPHCHNMIAIDDIQSVAYIGNGGIGVQTAEFVCNECCCSNSCTKCGEFDENLKPLFDDDFCEYCYEDKVKEIIETFENETFKSFPVLESENFLNEEFKQFELKNRIGYMNSILSQINEDYSYNTNGIVYQYEVLLSHFNELIAILNENKEV